MKSSLAFIQLKSNSRLIPGIVLHGRGLVVPSAPVTDGRVTTLIVGGADTLEVFQLLRDGTDEF